MVPGTGLIVKQQNLSRRVTADRRRAVLAATAADAAPAVAPADDGERATRGVVVTCGLRCAGARQTPRQSERASPPFARSAPQQPGCRVT